MLATPLDASAPPRERLMWVKLKDQRVFWPACVYEDYNEAVSHAHDVSTARAHKPVLDAEDRVVFFFGVRHVAHGAATHGSVVPSLRVCVVDTASVTAHVWDGADDFGNVCRTHHVDAETIARVEQNSAFQRACSDATRFHEQAHDAAAASQLFMAFLVAPKTRGGSVQYARSTLSASRVVAAASHRVSSVKNEKVVDKVVPQAPVVTIQNKVETELVDQPKLTEEVTTLCWSLMEQSGWTTFVKPDGSKIYAMPGVQFFEFRPNETVFEALHDACVKFLELWAQSNSTEVANDNQLQDCFWTMMLASGWQTIKSADQVMYVMPNTTFDRFIPNETIFQSKQAAMAKFLHQFGVEGQTHASDPNVSDDHDSDMASSSEEEAEQETSQPNQTSDIEMSDAESDIHDESESASGEDEDGEEEEEGEEEEDYDDEEEDDRFPVKRSGRSTLAYKKMTEVASRLPRRRKATSQQLFVRVAPPFKLKQGQVELELRNRGWFWKAVSTRKSVDGFMYFKPGSESKDAEELRVGQDCFAGYLSVEAYIREFEPEIIEKLRSDHEAAYAKPHICADASKKPTRKRSMSKVQPRRIDVIEVSDDETDEDIQRPNGNDDLSDQKRVTPVKRKNDGEQNVQTPAPKKVKSNIQERPEFLTPPPSERVKASSTARQQGDYEPTQDISALTESNPQISPESTLSKSRKDESTQDRPARNLNDAFTPSPTAEKTLKGKETRKQILTAGELAQQSITRLSLAHQPSTFSHREPEAGKIIDFCRGCFEEQRGGSLYLSGSPGCGKSALLRSLSEHIEQLHEGSTNSTDSIVTIHVNAMGLNDFNQLFSQVAQALTSKEFADGDEAFDAIERATKTGLKRSKTLLLILDEIDALGKTSMETELCRLFELAHRHGHSFILVGIANQIDFTERHLASLRLQLPNIKPQVIVFKPYSFQTISDILMDRLGGPAEASRIVNAHGVAFIARKVAAQSGDVRLALDICRRVLQQKLSESATSGGDDFGSPISLIDIVKTIKTVLEGKSKSNVSSLPRNLQMILFATTRLVAQANCVASTPTSSPTDDSSTTHKLYRVDDLYECYCDVSHDAGVFKPLTRGEFKLGLETLSSEGMIGGPELKKQLLKLLCTPSELLQTFKNDAYFSRLI